MKMLLILVLGIFVTSCAPNIPSQNDMAVCPCDFIYGHESDWNVISDDLARNIYRHNLMCEYMRN